MHGKIISLFGMLALLACAEADDSPGADGAAGVGGEGAVGGFGGDGAAGGGGVGGGSGNERPDLKRIGDREAPVGALLEIQLEATDPEGAPLSYTIRSDLPEGAKFEKPTGLFTWTPTPDQEGNIKLLTFEVSDGELKDQETIQITVIPADQAGNRPPVMEPIGDQVAPTGRLFSLQVVATDPNGDALTYSLRGELPGATFDGATGLFEWTPGEDLAGQSFDVTFVAADAEFEATEDVKLVVRGGDDPGNLPPRIRPIEDQQVQVGVEFRLVVEADDDNPDALIFGLAGPAPGGAGFDAQDHTFFWTPLPDQANQAIPVVFQVSDGEFRAVERVTFQVVGEGPVMGECTPDPEGEEVLVVASGDDLARSICPAGQLDTYAISLQEGDRLTVITSFQHSVCDIDFDIFGPTGGNPIGRAQGTTDLEEVAVAAVEGGEHTIVVACLDPAVVLDYEILFEVEPGGGPVECIEDDFEVAGGDDQADAQALPIDAPLQICPRDVDFWSFEALAGEQITLDILFTHADGDLDTRLYGPDGAQVGQSAGSDDDERIVTVAPADGEYVLEVYGYMDAANYYVLGLDLLPPVPCDADRVEPNDEQANAEPFRPEAYNNLTWCGEPDWYKTDVPDGQALQVFISYTGSAPDMVAYTMGGSTVPGQTYDVAMGDGCRPNRAGCRRLMANGPDGGGFVFYTVEAGMPGQSYDFSVRLVPAE